VEKKRFRAWEQLRPDVQEARRAFREVMAGIDLDSVVFLDETGCNIQMARQHGWGLRGSHVYDYIPGSRGPNMTVVGAIRRDRVLCHEVFQGALNKEKWRSFVEKKLVPRLHPGQVLVLDNLQVHKDPASLDLLERSGVVVLFQPPYSPDLNPIELCWAFIKRHLRRMRQRVAANLAPAVRRALERVTTRLLEGWYQHCCNQPI
jgi:transposase